MFFLPDDKSVSNLYSLGMEPIEVPLEEDGEQAQIYQSKVCADRWVSVAGEDLSPSAGNTAGEESSAL